MKHPLPNTAPRPRKTFLAVCYNWHGVEGLLYRSAQLYGRHAAKLLAHFQVRTVLNLRGENANSPWYQNERTACAQLGITHIDLPLSSRRLPQREALLALLNAFDRMEMPAVMKCSGGADRTGLSAFLYLLHTKGRGALPQAKRQLKLFPYLHLPKKYQRWMRLFPTYLETTWAPDTTLHDWLAHTYSDDAFAAWLKQNNAGDYWKP